MDDTGPTPAFLQAFKTITGKEWTYEAEAEVAREQPRLLAAVCEHARIMDDANDQDEPPTLH
jgi:hypothetical protein